MQWTPIGRWLRGDRTRPPSLRAALVDDVVVLGVCAAVLLVLSIANRWEATTGLLVWGAVLVGTVVARAPVYLWLRRQGTAERGRPGPPEGL